MTDTNLESIQNKMDTNLQNIISILKYPVISDKSTLLLENNKEQLLKNLSTKNRAVHCFRYNL